MVCPTAPDITSLLICQYDEKPPQCGRYGFRPVNRNQSSACYLSSSSRAELSSASLEKEGPAPIAFLGKIPGRSTQPTVREPCTRRDDPNLPTVYQNGGEGNKGYLYRNRGVRQITSEGPAGNLPSLLTSAGGQKKARQRRRDYDPF